MSLITYPVAADPRAFLPRSFSAMQTVNQRTFASPFGGSEQSVDMLNDRWSVSLELPPCTQAQAAKREAFVNALRGQANHTELHHFGRPVPLGTLRGSQGLIYDAPQGADSITIATTAGATLLAGDMLGVDGLLLQCRAECVADANGVLVVPLVNRLRRAVAGLRRASAATYIDGAGVLQTAAADVPRFQGGALLVEAAGTNTALQSSNPTSWTLSGVTLGSTATAPDGTSTAQAFLETVDTVGHFTNFGTVSFDAGKRYVFSVFAAEVPGSLKRFPGILLPASVFGATRSVCFDLATGAMGTPTGGVTDYGVQAVAGGFRIWLAYVATSTGTAAPQLRSCTVLNNASTVAAGDTSSGIIFWGRQIEQKDAGGPGSYVPAGATAATRAADVLAPVVWNKPTAPFRLVGSPAPRYVPGYAEGMSLDFVEKVD